MDHVIQSGSVWGADNRATAPSSQGGAVLQMERKLSVTVCGVDTGGRAVSAVLLGGVAEGAQPGGASRAAHQPAQPDLALVLLRQ